MHSREEKSMAFTRFPKESKAKSKLKINILVLQTGKLRLRRMESFTMSHSACNGQAKVLPQHILLRASHEPPWLSVCLRGTERCSRCLNIEAQDQDSD